MTDDTIRWQSVADATKRESHRFVASMYPERIKTWDNGIEPPQVTVIARRCQLLEILPQTINAQYGKYAQRIFSKYPIVSFDDTGNRHYEVFPQGNRFVTKLYVKGFLCRVLRSKRLKLAIGKGERWTNPS